MATTKTFKAGDTVQLNAGGPVMSINRVNTTTSGIVTYDCQWFAGKKLDVGRFAPEQLIAAVPSTQPPAKP